MRRVAVWSLLITGAMALCPSGGWAQGETTSAIVGQVTDATHAAVPGAKVTITSRETGLTRSVTDRCGGAVQLPPAKTWRLLGSSGSGRLRGAAG